MLIVAALGMSSCDVFGGSSAPYYTTSVQKGTLEVDGDSVTMTTTHEKEADETGFIPDDAEWVAVTDSTPSTATWAVDGDTLTLTYDDGIVEYTKVTE